MHVYAYISIRILHSSPHTKYNTPNTLPPSHSGFESRMLLMAERVALQERQLADAERALQAVKEGR